MSPGPGVSAAGIQGRGFPSSATPGVNPAQLADGRE